MHIIHNITTDMARRMPMVPVDAVQGDGNTRILKLTLLENGESWAVPEGVTGAVAFRKPDGTKGLYDTLPDGTRAVTMEGSTVSAVLAPQILSRAGEVSATVVFHDGDLNQLAAFPVLIRVAANPAAGQTVSNDYYRYSTMAAVSDALSEMAPAILCEAAGEVIAVADAADRPMKGLSIYGRTVQNGIPTPSAPVALESVGESIGVTVAGKNLLPFPYATTAQTMSGVTFTHGTDGTITCNGTASEKLWYPLNKNFVFLPGVTYTLSGGYVGGGTGDTYFLYCEGTYNGAGFYYADTGNGITFSFENGATGKIYIMIAKGITVSNIVFRPQVEIGNTATVYEPYKGQTLTATAEGGLHGIGEVKDEIDFTRGVRVQRVYRLVLTGTENFGMQTNENGARFILGNIPNGRNLRDPLSQLCTHAVYSTNANDTYGAQGTFSVYEEGRIFINLSSCQSVDAFKALLTQQYDNGTPVTVQYILITPIETPLTADELAAIAALHSNKPNTTVFNDSGAGMKLSYVADTKLYIDQKLAAISAALLNT